MQPAELWQKAQTQLRPTLQKLNRHAQTWQAQATAWWQQEPVRHLRQELVDTAQTWRARLTTQAKQWLEQVQRHRNQP
ncbi:MAG: hypothetical protein RMI89_00200 [Gloeomargarita sp. SKYBB_i_bin120]|nr:hypothetical protein [Gloeomargarita sp. SKYG98]MCS7291383.1 hypothetical protein [Gloeomargarita sp. SKYB120]MDW8176943.1 hypothetical protein [Gloeomargarita sp. SKYBB_i_bin120]